MNAAAQRLVDVHADSAENYMKTTNAAMHRSWLETMNGSNEGMSAWQRKAIAMNNAARLKLARQEDAYLARYASLVRERAIRPQGITPDMVSTEAMRGVDDMKLWRRPIATTLTAMQEGEDFPTAFRRGWYRASELCDEQLQLTRAHVARELMKKMDEIDGWVRKPSRGACELCLASALRKYMTNQLMPSHPHCRCSIVPSFHKAPAPLQVDPVETVAKVAALAGVAAASAKAAQALVEVRSHGELGPTLTAEDQQFTGPREIP